MYIKKALYKNVGPIRDIQIEFPFTEGGFPKPIVFVGSNGSGKSTVLSNIVDAFYEMASKAYSNAREGDENEQYYKGILPAHINYGESYMYSYLTFMDAKESFYLFKSGDITKDELYNAIDSNKNFTDVNQSNNYKRTSLTKQEAERVWDSNVICYFGPDRYEKPMWMGDKYYNCDENPHLSVYESISGDIRNPIYVKNVTSINLYWLMDVIADSRPDVSVVDEGISIVNTSVSDIKVLSQARNNLEKILSVILEEDVFFSLNYRNNKVLRFKIIRKKDNTVVAPTLDSLSTGQIALFNLFSTIVRYADVNDINKSFNLSDITGMVVIDEIELHLHTKLQKEVIPNLMKLFPRMQFIITTHAPLFLLGMKDVYGEDGFEIYELPSAKRIDIERFSEFKNAYQYLKETELYQKDIEDAIYSFNSEEKTIVITEGSTDWKHMKAALNHLKKDDKYNGLFADLNFDFFEYESANSKVEFERKLQMGNTTLVSLCENMAKIPQKNRYIFISDRDHVETNKKMAESGKDYKYWGNNVYSMIIPIPDHRMNTPLISIEHYYSDDEIKTEYIDPDSKVVRRLYMGNEFDNRGIAKEIDRYCDNRKKCGESSISIIEGDQRERVTSIKEDPEINYALPKSLFAEKILKEEAPFDNMNFDSFIQLFRIIKDIINDKP